MSLVPNIFELYIFVLELNMRIFFIACIFSLAECLKAGGRMPKKWVNYESSVLRCLAAAYVFRFSQSTICVKSSVGAKSDGTGRMVSLTAALASQTVVRLSATVAWDGQAITESLIAQAVTLEMSSDDAPRTEVEILIARLRLLRSNFFLKCMLPACVVLSLNLNIPNH